MNLGEAGPSKEGGGRVAVKLAEKVVAIDVKDNDDISVNKTRNEEVENFEFYLY